MEFTLSYTVLARRYRSQTFDGVVGQDPIARTLRNAIDTDRTAHAYLFCGTRGVGKTSMARIFARELNVSNDLLEVEAIGDAILRGDDLDVIEIDGASNRGVQEARDLIAAAGLAPTRCKYRIYIIDEVHMLTNEAFNALLKTLEEPPAHALLILATTEVEKIPLTIVSRCQRFDFRRISVSAMCQKLQKLCVSENVNVEQSALELIATKSTGSLRDAENILEQSIVTYGENITEKDIRELLHLGEDFSTSHLLKKIIFGETGEVIRSLSGLISDGHEPKQVTDNILNLMRNLILHISGVDVPDQMRDEIEAFLEHKKNEVSVPKLVILAKIMNGIDFRNSLDRTLPLEIALVEATISFSENSKSNNSFMASSVVPGIQSERDVKIPVSNNPKQSRIENAPAFPSNSSGVNNFNRKPLFNPGRAPQVPMNKQETLIREGINGDLDHKWNDLLRALRQIGNRFNLGALLRGCVSKAIDDNDLIFFFKHSSHVERIKSEIDNPSVLNQLREAVQDVLGERYEIKVELLDNGVAGSGKSASQKSHLVRAAQSLGAQIVEEREK